MLDPVRSVKCLLGEIPDDSETAGALTVPGWRERAERRFDDVMEQSWQSGDTQRLIAAFELGCALLWDSRLLAARYRFLNLLNHPGDASPQKVLALLGYGRANTLLARFEPAHQAFVSARRDAAALHHPLLQVVAEIFCMINDSDGGIDTTTASQRDPRFALARVEIQPSEIRPLVDAWRVFALSRTYMRQGRRGDGLDLVSEHVRHKSFGDVPPIARAMVHRMHGVLNAYCGDHPYARESLKHAIGAFRTMGYALGEVQAAFSLARMSRPLGRETMLHYLRRASEIIERTVSAHDERMRQMPAEQAQIHARMGDFELAHGRLEEALQRYQKDLELSRELASPAAGDGQRADERAGEVSWARSTAPSRALAYANYNVGRALAALGREPEALTYLDTSAEMFESLGDPYNVFQARVCQCEAAFQIADNRRGIERLLAAVESVFGNAPGRTKERAIIAVLRARYLHQFGGDPLMALGHIREARRTLGQHDPDYYYVRALAVEGEILATSGDRQAARDRLFRARDFAESLELEDVRRPVERLLERYQFKPGEKTARTGHFHAAVLFTRILGITPSCRHIEVNQMAAFLRDLTDLVGNRCVLWEGEPLRLLGDSMLSIFCATSDRAKPQSCLALGAAGEISERFGPLCTRWAATNKAFNDLQIGFAMAAGDVALVYLGSELGRSVIGEPVAEADRLQRFAHDGEILLSSVAAREVLGYAKKMPITERSVQLDDYPAPVRVQVVQARVVVPLLRSARQYDTVELQLSPAELARIRQAHVRALDDDD